MIISKDITITLLYKSTNTDKYDHGKNSITNITSGTRYKNTNRLHINLNQYQYTRKEKVKGEGFGADWDKTVNWDKSVSLKEYLKMKRII